MQVTPHFSLDDLTKTSTGLPNEPEVGCAANMLRLSESLLEPILTLLGGPLVVHSCYRSPQVNQRVGGDPASAHLEARACDFHPAGQGIHEAFERIRVSEIPYDKLIIEHHGGAEWIHAQIRKAGLPPRRVAMTATVTASGTVYQRVDA